MAAEGIPTCAPVFRALILRSRAPYESAPVGFLLDVDMDSDASFEDQTRLLEAAKKGCFIEATLANPIPVHHRIERDGEFVEVD